MTRDFFVWQGSKVEGIVELFQGFADAARWKKIRQDAQANESAVP
jgi:hypothetical protein